MSTSPAAPAPTAVALSATDRLVAARCASEIANADDATRSRLIDVHRNSLKQLERDRDLLERRLAATARAIALRTLILELHDASSTS